MPFSRTCLFAISDSRQWPFLLPRGQLRAYTSISDAISIANLIGCLHRQGIAPGLPEKLISEIQGLTTREEKQTLKKMRKLRNAFAHYDFGPAIVSAVWDSKDPQEILEEAIQNTVGMSSEEYVRFLRVMQVELVEKLQQMLRMWLQAFRRP